MIFRSFRVGSIALALSVGAFTFGTSNGLIAKDSVHQFVKPAQIFLQDTSALTPVLGKPISFSQITIKENVKAEKNKSVFKIEVPGLYEITSFFLVTTTAPGGASVTNAILINGKVLDNLIDSNVVSTTPLQAITTRRIYLKRGDKISVVITSAPSGTTILERGLHFVALNNSK